MLEHYNIDPNIYYLGYPNGKDSSLSSDDGDQADDDVDGDGGDNFDKKDNGITLWLLR